MASTTSVDGSTLDGFFKDIYQDGVTRLLPDNIKLYRNISWNNRELIGEKIVAAVLTQRSNGFTYGGYQNSAFALNSPVPMETKQAYVYGNQVVLREYISMSTATRGASSKQAFLETIGLVIDNMMESFGNTIESDLLYGGSTLGTFTAVTATSGLQFTATLTTSQWAIGLWAGMEGCKYNFVNTNTQALVGNATPTNADATFTLVSVDTDNFVLTFEAGSAAGLAALVGTTVSYLNIYRQGAWNMNMVGLDRITSNTGVLFGISASQYSLWKSIQQTITGSLTVGKLNKTIAKMVGKGLMENVQLFVSPNTWTDMISDVIAQRIFDSSYEEGKAVLGNKALKFVSQSGEVEVVPHNMIKQGEAFLGPVYNRMERVGSSDITMESPAKEAGSGPKIFVFLQDYSGFDVRAFSDQSLFTKVPGKFAKISGITNSSG